MTDAQKVEMYRLRIQEKKSFEAIGREFGISKQRVAKILDNPVTIIKGKEKYPKLYNCLIKEFGTIDKASKELGFTVSNILYGKTKNLHQEELCKRYNLSAKVLFDERV